MRILLVEDSKKLVDSLRTGLTKAGFEVAVAMNGETGLRMALCGSWDVVVLDLMLLGLAGDEVLRRVRAEGCGVHVLVLTALGTVEDRVRGLEALTRRKHGNKSPVLSVADLEVDTAGRTVRRNGESVSLTHREYRLLEPLALRESQTISRAEIEEHLYGSRSLPEALLAA